MKVLKRIAIVMAVIFVVLGEYKLVSTSDMGYYCIYADSRHDINNIIANDNFTGQNYCNVKDGQYLVLHRCKISE